MPRFRLVHLSDLHLARTPRQVDLLQAGRNMPQLLQGNRLSWFSSYLPAALRTAAAFVYRRHRDLDGVLITGDLATTGYRPDDLLLAKTVVSAPNPGQRHLLPHPFNATGRFPTVRHVPTAWIPGNHDRYASNLFAPGGRAFDQIVGWAGTGAQRVTLATGLHVVGLDCSMRALSPLDSGLERLAVGEVCDQLLDEARAASARTADDDALLWLVHWPPEFDGGDRQMRLEGEARLLALADELDVDLVLSGHTHETRVYLTSVGVPVVCCGTTSQSLSGATPHSLLELTFARAGRLFSAVVDVWEFDRHRVDFVLQRSWSLDRNLQGSVAVSPRALRP